MDYFTKFDDSDIHPTVFIGEGVRICGRVKISKDSSIWFNSVLRGDTELIQIGERSNVQDLCMVHADPGKPAIIGDDVTVGHGAIIHGARVEDGSMIGIRATVLNDAVIGHGSLIAAGALIPERMVVPPFSVVMGVPGKVVRSCTDNDLQRIKHASEHYVEASRQFRQSNE